MTGPTPAQRWFRQRPVVAGLLMVAVVLAVGGLAAPIADGLGLPWAASLVLLPVLLVAGFALSRVLIGVLMGREGD